ncbi:MAG TPA: mechanosensitive ion channel family protein, partial [Mycobacterium sp.]|nr:mechanosensitive ion channel family protein [Mycobacterium sp.]
EITLTYVVVHVWDDRRMVLPSSYFTTTPFENWTRNATEIMGAVEFDVDFSVPFHDMRAELDRLLADSEEWDGRRGVLQVTDAVGGVVRVRIVVSASNAGALFDLRCAVREGMVDWVRRTGGLPTQRIEPTAPASEPVDRNDDGETPRVAASLFSGSPEADARGRAFDETRDYDGEFAKPNGRA